MENSKEEAKEKAKEEKGRREKIIDEIIKEHKRFVELAEKLEKISKGKENKK